MHWFLYVLSSSGMGVRGGAQFPPCHHSWDIRMFKRQHWHNGCGKGHGECGWGGEEEDGRFCVELGREEAMLKGQKLFFSVVESLFSNEIQGIPVFTITAVLVGEGLGLRGPPLWRSRSSGQFESSEAESGFSHSTPWPWVSTANTCHGHHLQQKFTLMCFLNFMFINFI